MSITICIMNIYKAQNTNTNVIVKNTFGDRNNTFCDKTLNKCIANVYFFRILLPEIINIESVFLFIGYMNAF